MKLNRHSSIILAGVLTLAFGLTGLVSSAQLGLVINEIMLSNATTIASEENEFPDWIELYNGSGEDVNLNGYGLSDRDDDLFQWSFPDVIIYQGEYLIIFASNEDMFEDGYYHTNFKLSSAGERVILTKPSQIILDQIDPVSVGTDISYGRYPDGSEHMERLYSSTPGESNNSVNGILFSHESGYFTSSFELNISPSGNQEIRYTTDGSDPDMDSPIYSAPILLGELTDAPNVYSEIETSPSWNTPEDLVYKCHVIRAALFDGDEIDSEIYHKTYFVDPDIYDRYAGYNVLSIITDPDNLFNPDSGIYVPGQYFEASNTTWTGNYFKKGIEWERNGNFQYFSANGQLLVDQNVGLRIHGGKGRNLPQKSFRVYARDDYGAPRVNYPFFEFKDTEVHSRLVVRNTQSGWQKTVIKDECTAYVCRNLNIEVSASQPVVVFLNGEYWGLQSIREYLDDNFISEAHHIEEDSVNMVLHGSGNRPTLPDDWGTVHGTNEGHIALYEFLNNNSLDDQVNYDYVASWLNIESIVDYYCAEVYFNNADWPTNNNKLWQEGLDGQWSQLFYDLDGGWSYLGTSFNALHRALSDNGSAQAAPYATLLFRKLMEAPDFYDAYLTRMACLMKNDFSQETLNEAIDIYKAKYFEGIPEHIERWNDPVSMAVWENKVQTMVVFAEYRKDYMITHINDEFLIDFDPESYDCIVIAPPPVDDDLGLESEVGAEDEPLDLTEINELDQMVVVYPNPSVNGHVWLDFNLNVAQVNYEIYDLRGKLLKTGTARHHDQITMPDSNGSYVIRVLNGQNYTTRTLLVQ